MGYESLTDEKIISLLTLPKKITNPNITPKEKGAHWELNYNVIGKQNPSDQFRLYSRQNTIEHDDFSCGLTWVMPSGEEVHLVRYNGKSHTHPNRLEHQTIPFQYHIHRATEKYIRAGKKPEGYAEATERYQDLQGAFRCLLTDCCIKGFTKQHQIEIVEFAS